MSRCCRTTARTRSAPDFLPTEADYTDPDLQKAIDAHGWMIWPPVPYSYDTIVKNLPTPGAVAADLAQPARHRRPGARRAGAGDLRLSPFGAVRLHADHRRPRPSASPPARCRAITAALTDLLFQRFIEIWNGMPQLYLLIILGSIITPGFWVLLVFLLLFSLDEPDRRGARRVPARPQPRLCARGQGARRVRHRA